LDSNEPDTPSSAKSNGTRSAKPSSESIGPMSPSTETFPPMNRQDQPTSSAEVSPVKTSQSLDEGRDSRVNDLAFSSRQPESLTLFSQPEDGFSLRMYPDSFPQTVDEISPSFSRRWPTSGFTTSLGECWTLSTSESPNEGGAYSSLPDALEADAPPRFYVSQRGAAGILQRAVRRGKHLPKPLESALRDRSAQQPTNDPTTSMDTRHMLVRRLTPTECERLQGFPDGWTIP
jgi:site-specific DNA-cytosine methylase